MACSLVICGSGWGGRLLCQIAPVHLESTAILAERVVAFDYSGKMPHVVGQWDLLPIGRYGQTVIATGEITKKSVQIATKRGTSELSRDVERRVRATPKEKSGKPVRDRDSSKYSQSPFLLPPSKKKLAPHNHRQVSERHRKN